MSNREEIKRKHERAVADHLLEALKIGTKLERFGDPKNQEPDVIYKIDGRNVGVEVATAYYENSDAKDQWEIAAGERPLAAGERRPRSAGVIANPDKLICEKVQAELNDKCGRRYAGTDEMWLCINQQAPLSDAKSVEQCVKKLKIPPGHKFTRIYLTYTAPLGEGGGYTVVKIC